MEKKTTVLISYNPVKGFSSGWHGAGKVFVCANDLGPGASIGEGGDNRQRAGSVMHSISNRFYHGSVPVEGVRRYYVYAGLNAFHGAISMAKNLRDQAPGVPMTVVACHCDWFEKLRLLEGTDIRIEKCECSGRDTLGRIARAAVVEMPSHV